MIAKVFQFWKPKKSSLVQLTKKLGKTGKPANLSLLKWFFKPLNHLLLNSLVCLDTQVFFLFYQNNKNTQYTKILLIIIFGQTPRECSRPPWDSSAALLNTSLKLMDESVKSPSGTQGQREERALTSSHASLQISKHYRGTFLCQVPNQVLGHKDNHH